jgi:hypothetical protein
VTDVERGVENCRRLASGEATVDEIMTEARLRKTNRVEAAFAAPRTDLGDLTDLLEVAQVAPKVLALKFANLETAVETAVQLKTDADYIIIERSMAIELVLVAIERERIGEEEGI